MSFLDKLVVADDVAPEEDRLPGARIQATDSGVYPVKIDMAYIDESSGGAYTLHLTVKEDPFEGFTVRQNLYMTTGKAKGQRNYFVTQQGVKKLLKGMATVEDICLSSTGKKMTDQTVEKKVIKLWSFEAKKEMPVEKDVVTSLLGQTFQAGILKKIENKRADQGNGVWGPTAAKKEFNEIDKAFDANGLSAVEKNGGSTTPDFMGRWKEKWDGVTDDQYDPNVKGEAPTAKTVPAGAKETPDLFG